MAQRRKFPTLILGSMSCFLLIWNRAYFTDAPLPSVDLPGHIALTEQLLANLPSGVFSFYDPSMFTGWAAFRFDGILPYLVTAILSLILRPFSEEPVRFAAQSLLALGTALLPFSLYYAVRPFVPLSRGSVTRLAHPGSDLDSSAHESGALYDGLSSIGLAAMSSVFAFWFLNHDGQWFGIGQAAPMNIGLYPQLFGWHFLLLLCGAAGRVVSEAPVSREGTALRRAPCKAVATCAVALSLIAISHLQTLVFSVALLGTFILIFTEHGKALGRSLLLGLGAAAFFLLPLFTQLDYTAYDIYRPRGDLLQLLFRYPFQDLVMAARAWKLGDPIGLDPISLLLPLLLFAAITIPRIRSYRPLSGLFLFLMLGLICSSSGFIASSLPFAFHYYRFIGYLFLIAVVAFTAVAAALPDLTRIATRPFAYAVAMSSAFGGIISTAMLPHQERAMIIAHGDGRYLDQEDQLLSYLRNKGSRGRVYVEYLTDYKKFPPLSAHYLASNALKRAGYESISNTFLQRSAAYRVVMGTAKLLGARTYNVPLLFTHNATLNDESKLDQLRSFGITDIVAGTDRFKARLRKVGLTPAFVIGPYELFEIQKPPFAPVAKVEKKVVGYFDKEGSLPFRLLALYFYGRQELYRGFELVQLHDSKAIPAGIDVLLVNSRELITTAPRPKHFPAVLVIDYRRRFKLDHYRPYYSNNVEQDAYRDMEKFLDSAKLEERLGQAIGSDARQEDQPASSAPTPSLIWEEGYQRLALTNLVPGTLYRINYSYFPYWGSEDGMLFRGSAERMFFLAAKDEASISYAPLRLASTWAGIGLSALSLATLLYSVRGRRLSASLRPSALDTAGQARQRLA